jgi:hypothetical protein
MNRQPNGILLVAYHRPCLTLRQAISLRDWLTKRIDEIEAAQTARKKARKPRKARA